MTTILFLDFDGVLHPETADADLFCRAPNLWRILRACPHVSVVFSTAWRQSFPLQELVCFATQGGGEDLKGRFLGVTPTIETAPVFADHGCREVECLEWLVGHGHVATHWLAVDDIEYLFSPSSPNLYLTDFRLGLTEADTRKVAHRLNHGVSQSNLQRRKRV